MARFANSVLFTPVSSGTVDFVVSAEVAGYMTPALAGAPTGVYKYRAESTDLTQWEIGEGTYTSGTTTLTRDTVLYNSSGSGTAVGQSGAGTKINFTVAPSIGFVQAVEDTLGIDQTNSFTTTQKSQARLNISADFETGTVALFYQAAAPTGWTKLVTQDDKALRVVSGSGGVAGGTNAFSTVMAQTVVGSSTLSTAQLAAHAHTPSGGLTNWYGAAAGGGGAALVGGSGASTSTSTSNTGSGSSHNHTITMSVQYIDLILASKD